MSKEEIRSHAAVKTAVALGGYALSRELDLGDFFINGVLITNVEANVSNNPDMVAVLWESLETGKVRYLTTDRDREMEIEGSPDWVLEIVSNSSITKDTRDLRVAYHGAGIREYWIIDARGADIRFQILHWRKSSQQRRADGWQRSRVFSRLFCLSRCPKTGVEAGGTKLAAKTEVKTSTRGAAHTGSPEYGTTSWNYK